MNSHSSNITNWGLKFNSQEKGNGSLLVPGPLQGDMRLSLGTQPSKLPLYPQIQIQVTPAGQNPMSRNRTPTSNDEGDFCDGNTRPRSNAVLQTTLFKFFDNDFKPEEEEKNNYEENFELDPMINKQINQILDDEDIIEDSETATVRKHLMPPKFKEKNKNKKNRSINIKNEGEKDLISNLESEPLESPLFMPKKNSKVLHGGPNPFSPKTLNYFDIKEEIEPKTSEMFIEEDFSDPKPVHKLTDYEKFRRLEMKEYLNQVMTKKSNTTPWDDKT